MGSELFKQYQVDKSTFINGGHMNMWKIYNGTHKTLKNKVCVFVFDKADLNQYSSKDRDAIIAVLKKEATGLVKYKHPNILSIVEPLVEDKYSLGFVTEYFSNTLTKWGQKTEPSKIEIKMIISDICHTLNFLHNDCGDVHMNLNPDCIFINEDNTKIKIGGFNFAMGQNDISNFSFNNFTPECNPCLSYLSPEAILDNKISSKCDIFSLGMLIYNLILHCKEDAICLNSNTPETYRKVYNENQIEKLINNKKQLTEGDKEIILKLIENDYKKRPDTFSIMKYEWFTDYTLKALIFIENLATNDIKKNVMFLKELPSMLGLFEEKIIARKFLPCLLINLKNELLINPILPVIFTICHLNFKSINFNQIVWPYLIDIFKLKTIPAASLYFLLTKIPFIGANISNDDFSHHCLDIICKALDCGVSKIQRAVIKNIVFISQKVDSKIFIDKLYPRLNQIMLISNDVNLKSQIIFSYLKLYDIIDRNIINTSFISNIEEVIRKNSEFKICYAVVDLMGELEDSFSIDAIINKIIPLLVVILGKGKITSQLYEKISFLVQKFLEKVKRARDNEIKEENKETEEEEIKVMKRLEGDAITIDIDVTSKNIMKKGNEFLKEFFSESTTKKEIIEEKVNTITKDTSNYTFAQIIDLKSKTNENKQSTSLSLSTSKKKNGWDDEDNDDDFPSIIPQQKEEPQKKIQKITKIEKATLDSLLDD